MSVKHSSVIVIQIPETWYIQDGFSLIRNVPVLLFIILNILKGQYHKILRHLFFIKQFLLVPLDRTSIFVEYPWSYSYTKSTPR
jgi:hypothetical protein